MREVDILKFCDPCWADGEQRVKATSAFVVSVRQDEQRPGEPRLIETCETHHKLFADLLELVYDHGSNLRPITPSHHAAAGRHPAPVGPQRECPVCHEKFASTYLPVHIWTGHIGKPRPPMPSTCPSCAFVPADGKRAPASVGRHRVITHDYDPVTDAMISYEALAKRTKRRQ